MNYSPRKYIGTLREVLLSHRRFSRRVWRASPCWLWTGARNSDGYGHIQRPNGKTALIHRLAFTVFRQRRIPKGKLVLHWCDVRACFNPAHLHVGTYADNNRETVLRGNHRNAYN